jgi:hypothetical protein
MRPRWFIWTQFAEAKTLTCWPVATPLTARRVVRPGGSQMDRLRVDARCCPFGCTPPKVQVDQGLAGRRPPKAADWGPAVAQHAPPPSPLRFPVPRVPDCQSRHRRNPSSLRYENLRSARRKSMLGQQHLSTLVPGMGNLCSQACLFTCQSILRFVQEYDDCGFTLLAGYVACRGRSGSVPNCEPCIRLRKTLYIR